MALAGPGWTIDEIVDHGRVAGRRPHGPRRDLVDVEALRPSWAAMWRRSIPGIEDAVVADLADRYLLQQSVVDNRYLAVREDGEIVASALLSIDGATAWLNDVEHSTRSTASAATATLLVAEAMALAAEAGCDTVGLGAVADDWPRTWYARRGFSRGGPLLVRDAGMKYASRTKLW